MLLARPLVLSLLWPKNNRVALQLASRYGFDIAGLCGLFNPAEIEHVRKTGARYYDLGGAEVPKDPELFEHVRARVESVKEPLMRAVAGDGTQLRKRIAGAMLTAIGEEAYSAFYFTDLFDRLHGQNAVALVLLNEAETVLGKTAAQWGRKHGIPVCVISHGANLPNAYTVTRETANVDFLMVFGERGAEPYLDRKFPAERIFVTGNPAWDSMPTWLARRDQIRAQVFEQCHFDKSRPVVMLATTWDSNLSALNDGRGYERTLRSFCAAGKILEKRGLPVNLVVKDRPTNDTHGQSKSKAIAEQLELDAYHYVTGDLATFLTAADVMVGHESSAFVEAMLFGVPAINLWTPLTWIAGPALEREDGIPLIRWDAPDALADVITALLNDKRVKAELVSAMQSRLPRFHVANDGNSARRCADAAASIIGV